MESVHSKGFEKAKICFYNNKYNTDLRQHSDREMPISEEEKTKVDGGTATEEKYPWHLLRKTILLLNCFMGSCRCRYGYSILMIFSLSIWINHWDHWTHSAGLEGPARSQYWRSILHIDDELYRFSSRLLLYRIFAGQAASLQIPHTGR